MGYRIRGKDVSVEAAVRRIAGEQAGKAIAAIDRAPGSGLSHAEAVHEVRRRCKKLRGLVRLVRPVFAGYSEENAAFRDIARHIADARDAKVMQDTYDVLVARYSDEIDRRALGMVRRKLTLESKTRASVQDVAERLAQCRARLEQAQQRAEGWTIDASEFAALSGGLSQTYSRAQKAAAAAFAQPSPEALHDLRKRIKYHGFHARILVRLWPEMMESRILLARELSDLLGLHHDVAVFAAHIAADPLTYGGPQAVDTMTGLAGRYCTQLEREAEAMLGRLLAQAPEAMAQHWGELWRVWRKP